MEADANSTARAATPTINPAGQAAERAGESGFGVEYVDHDAEPIVFRRSWFESPGLVPGKLFAVHITNGSMQLYLWEGDTVVVNTDDTQPKDGVTFAVN